MTHDKIMIGGEMYTIFKQYANKAEAKAYAEISRKTKLFKSIRVHEIPKTHPLHVNGKYVLAMRGVSRDVSGLTAKGLMKEINAPARIEFDKRTGRLKKW